MEVRPWSEEVRQRIDAEIETISDKLGRAPTASELADALDMDREDVIDAMVAGSLRREDPAVAPRAGAIGTESDESGFMLPVELPELERTVLTLRCFHSLPQTHIARRLHISTAMVYDALARALAGVRDLEPSVCAVD